MPALPSTPDAAGPEWAALLRTLPGFDPFRAPGDAWFDAQAAKDAIEFIHECIRHVEGSLAGQLLQLEPWQRCIIANLFGWKRKDRKGREVRRFRKLFLYVPRKNGKTPLAAAIALYVLFCDNEAGQQNYLAAADRTQAGMLFRQCKGMVEQEEEMDSRCRMYGGKAEAGQSRSLVREDDGSFLRVISADADTKHGGNSHLVIVDELHTQPDRELVDVLATSMASANRRQPLFILITTADFDRPSICNEELEYAKKVRDGIIDDPALLPAVYETPDDADWKDPAVWRAANPNLGVSVSEEYLEAEAKKAAENPAYELTFRRLHLNQKTRTLSKVIDLAAWDDCGEEVDAESLKGRPCYGGLDLARVCDLSALALLFPPREEGERWKVLMRFWVPEDDMRQRSKRDRVPYDAWARMKLIVATPGNMTDFAFIEDCIVKTAGEFDLRELAFDRTFADAMISRLMDEGVNMVAFGQGFLSMGPAMAEFLRMLKGKLFQHGGNPVLRWCLSNLVARQDPAGNLKPDKEKSVERIDGAVALVMAVGRAMLDPDAMSVPEPFSVEVW